MQYIKLNTATTAFLAKLTSDTSYLTHSVVENVEMIGESLHLCLEADNKSLVEQFLGQGIHYNDVKAYNRAQVGKTFYTSKQYVKAKRRKNSTVIFLMQMKYGQIELLCALKKTVNVKVRSNLHLSMNSLLQA